jgi:glutaredoxin
MHRLLLRLSLLPSLLALIATGCSKAPDDAALAADAAATAPAPLMVQPPDADPGATSIIWRYVDPQSGEVASASAFDAIPAPARRQVVVYDPRNEPPPGWDYVADLTNGLPATAQPVANFRFTTRSSVANIVREPAPGSTTPTAAHEVIMFSTQGCGYCSKARKYLAANRIPFTELDVEEDPKAGPRLQALGQKAGLSPRDLQGVPILFIDGRPMVGWDERQVAKLLGLGG